MLALKRSNASSTMSVSPDGVGTTPLVVVVVWPQTVLVTLSGNRGVFPMTFPVTSSSFIWEWYGGILEIDLYQMTLEEGVSNKYLNRM